MATPKGRTLALGAAAALASVPVIGVVAVAASGQAAEPAPVSFGAAATSIADVAATLAGAAPAPVHAAARALQHTADVATAAKRSAIAARAVATDEPAVRNRTLLVRVHGGPLQRIEVRAGLDPATIAASLRHHPGTFTSAGADYVATAADIATDAEGNPLPTSPAAASLPSTTASASASNTTPATAAVQTGSIPSTTSTTPLPDATSPAATSPASTTTDDGITAPLVVPGAATDPAKIKGWIPNDHIGTVPWTSLQWNFAGKDGIDAPEAWATLRRRGTKYEGGNGVRIAVVDSGVAYRNQGVYRASPDLPASRILRGYDFVDDDRFPDDASGHGTHVASTIAGATDNDAGVTGIAYKADILPIRVLDEHDRGDVAAIARGIRYAVRHHAQLINMSIDFPVSITPAQIPEVMSAIAYARRKGVLMIASSGNARLADQEGGNRVGLPARSPSVLSVGSTTVRGCRSSFANAGPDLDISAPGGGPDRSGQPGCHPNRIGPPIVQITILDPPNPDDDPDPSQLGVPLDYEGTSMATGHVTGVAALVLGSGILGKHPSPDLLAAYLVRSTRDLGRPGRDDNFGAGLIDAAQAVSRTSARSRAALRGARRAAQLAAAHHDDALPVL